tara:strand:+ start:1244 stop:1837 length:594 start_codon:yes stop_codon:yes gene_type:complete
MVADKTILGGGGEVEITGALTASGTGTHSGTNTFTGTVNLENITEHKAGSGKYLKGIKNQVVKKVAWSTGATIPSGAIPLPAKTIITGLHVVVDTQLAFASGAVNIKAGTSAGNDAIANASNVVGSGTTLAVGKGASSDTAISTALGGAAPIVNVADSAYATAARDIHFTLTAAGGNFTAGVVSFVVEYMYVGESNE